eukprot:SM000208S06316  [mRNA]  locus=s208:12683:12940:- [translate_table: standard]
MLILFRRLSEGRRGSLVDESGRFYKPLQGGERGDQETSFYEKIQADESVPKNILAYFPRYYGTVVVNAEDGSGPCNIPSALPSSR